MTQHDDELAEWIKSADANSFADRLECLKHVRTRHRH